MFGGGGGLTACAEGDADFCGCGLVTLGRYGGGIEGRRGGRFTLRIGKPHHWHRPYFLVEQKSSTLSQYPIFNQCG